MFFLSMLLKAMTGQSYWLNNIHFGFLFSGVASFHKPGRASQAEMCFFVAVFSGLQWNEVGVSYCFLRPRTGTASYLADSGNALNTCYVMEFG